MRTTKCTIRKFVIGPFVIIMAAQVRAGQLFRYRSFHINKSQPLGHGSYGAVYKAKCDQLTCAAKVLHPTILDPLDPGAGKIMDRFRQECAFLESIRHPNIVQYLGMTRDPESRLPVLLMELLDESLTKMLERSPTALPYFVEVDICHDIALAVAYLHSNDIVHRDLSSNNVLIVAKRRAKVTDFGMSRISGAAPTMTPLTMCPGTLAYMSPEALKEPPTYTKKLDCFSEAVMMIQVCTRLWPEPGPRTKTVQDSRSPTGMIEMPVLEPERRQKHIDKIDRSHGLLPIAMDCLRYQENERPSSEELCERLAGLKETGEYRESMERVEREQNDIAGLERQIGEMQIREGATIQENRRLLGEIQSKEERLQSAERQVQLLKSQNQQLEGLKRELRSRNEQLNRQLEERAGNLQSKDRQLAEQAGQLQSINRQLEEQEQVIEENRRLLGEFQSKEERLQTAERQHEERERELRSRNEQLNRQLAEQEQVTAEIQQTNHSLQREVEQLQQQLSQQTGLNTKASHPPSPVALDAQVNGRELQQQYPIKVKQSQPSPQQDQLQKPHPPKRKVMLGEWRDGGKAPIDMCRGAAVVDGNVTYFLNWNGPIYSYNKRWRELPMCPAGNGSSLAVIKGLLTAIGGHGGGQQNKLLSLVDKKWVEQFPPMPTKRHSTAAVTTQHHLIVAGGWGGSNRLNTVEVMDIQTLVWSTAASLPHPYSNASAAICGDQLYMLGGFDNDGRTKSVLTCSLTSLLQSRSGTSSHSVWKRTSDAPAYHSTCVAVDGELLAVGGMDTSAVYKYSTNSNSWDLISIMLIARYSCLVAVLPTNTMMVVGGIEGMRTTDTVLIAKFQKD